MTFCVEEDGAGLGEACGDEGVFPAGGGGEFVARCCCYARAGSGEGEGCLADAVGGYYGGLVIDGEWFAWLAWWLSGWYD